MAESTVSECIMAIIGAGGQGRVVHDILFHNSTCDIVFFDNGIDKYADIKDIIRPEYEVMGAVVAIGDNSTRVAMADFLIENNIELCNAVHQTANIAYNVIRGKNITICRGAIVCVGAEICDSVILNSGCIIEHECVISEGVHVASGAKLAGHVVVGDKSHIGIGAIVLQGITIGRNVVVGAGAVVTKDIPDNTVVVGVPARKIRTR